MLTDNARTVASSDNAYSALKKLQSKDHGEILNVVDQLRSEGIGNYVDVPQIIVCGDQSSGKSSVLGAISDVSFPWRDNLCTRFAIELILRQAPESSVTVSIYPDDDRHSEEKDRLRSFRSPTVDLDQFQDIVRTAEEFMGIGRSGLLFSKDILRVEASGPSQPNLTLVDLPGLYHAPDENQDEEGVNFVETLVLSYMKKPRSVILAVVSAKADIPLQKVISFIRKVDPKGERTLGIITKPDTLSTGSDMEQTFLKLARNERVKLGLGWHVLKNRGFEERDFSIAERHASELEFLARGVWSSLSRTKVGVESLRSRLSGVLKNHILAQMPSFVAEIHTNLDDAVSDLKKLGHPRVTIHEQRRYLLSSSERFTSLIGSAVDGIYLDSFFGNSMEDAGYDKRLRAVIQNRLVDFAETMQQEGEHQKIVDDDDDDDDDDVQIGGVFITMTQYRDEVLKRMRRSRGLELPGTFNPLIVGELFFVQSQPWEAIVLNYIESLLLDARKVMMFVLREVLDERSIDGLLNYVLEDHLTVIEKGLREKTQELLKPQQKGHPITYNHYFTDTIQKARAQRGRDLTAKRLKSFFGNSYSANFVHNTQYTFVMSNLVATLSNEDHGDSEEFACVEAITCMKAYYKVARKKFVDDFSTLAVEHCLLKPLQTIFCPSTVEQLSDDIIKDVSSEDEATLLTREKLKEKISVLENSLTILQRLERAHLTGPSQQYEPVDDSSDFEDLLSRTSDVELVRSKGEEVARNLAAPPTPSEVFPDEEIANSEVVAVPESDDGAYTTSLKKYKKKKKHSSAVFWE